MAGVSPRNLTAHLAIVGANIIYGLNYVIAKGIMPDHMEPRAIIFLRGAGAIVLFWVLGYFFPREKVSLKDLGRLALSAFFGVFTNQILFFEGLNLTTPINAAIIVTIIPVLVLVFAHFLLHERITSNKLFGIILGMIGAVIVILSTGTISLRSDTFIGNILIFINAAAFALYLVLVKPMMMKYHPMIVIKWIFVFGFVFIAPVCFGTFIRTDFSAIPFQIWLSISYVVIATTAIAYFLNNYSLTKLSPTITGTYIYFQPMIASIVAILFAKDVLTIWKVIAALMIFAGVWFVSKKKKPQVTL